MTTQYIIGGAMILLAIVLVAIILKQTGKEQGLSSTLAGGADTFFGRAGGSTKEKRLAKITIALSVVFVVLALVLTVLIYRTQLGL